MCAALACAFSFTGYGDSQQESEQVSAIAGFGGYGLGGKLNPKQLNAKMRENGYVICKAKKTFRKFEKVQLHFTPKTFIIYKIYASEQGSKEDLKVIKASLERIYNEKMTNNFMQYQFSRNGRTVRTGHAIAFPKNINWISVTDDKLEKLNNKEKEEIVQSKVDTNGLGDSPKEAGKTAITGFGGYGLGRKLNQKILNAKMREKGYVICKAKKTFRKFEKVQLHFTPKTFIIYKIYASEQGSKEDLKVIKASLERIYNEKMTNNFMQYQFSRNGRTVRTGHAIAFPKNINWISVTDDKLEKLNNKEKEEIVQSKVDTSGL